MCGAQLLDRRVDRAPRHRARHKCRHQERQHRPRCPTHLQFFALFLERGVAHTLLQVHARVVSHQYLLALPQGIFRCALTTQVGAVNAKQGLHAYFLSAAELHLIVVVGDNHVVETLEIPRWQCNFDRPVGVTSCKAFATFNNGNISVNVCEEFF